MFLSSASTIAVYALAAFYWVVGVEILLRAVTPSCRVCVYRHSCPYRKRNHPSDTANLVCLGESSPKASHKGRVAKATFNCYVSKVRSLPSTSQLFVITITDSNR
jgi:hypothetical protein